MKQTFSLDFITPTDCETTQEFQTLQKSFDYAQEAHKDHLRKSGEPYFRHLYEVGKRIWGKYRDVELTAAAFLHDTVEDCDNVATGDIYNMFGDTIGFMVDAVSKCNFDFYKRDEKFRDKTARFLWAGQQDVRVCLLKLADREHNISTVKHLKPNKQIRMSFETQAVYEPLKKILSYDNPVTLQETSDKLTTFITENKLSDLTLLKEYLFNETYTNIDNDLYPLIYDHTDNVVWRVEGMAMYESLAYSKVFENRIKFVLLTASSGDEDNVKAFFKFKTGVVAKEENIKINISSYNTH